jgi:hypothetical protein
MPLEIVIWLPYIPNNPDSNSPIYVTCAVSWLRLGPTCVEFQELENINSMELSFKLTTGRWVMSRIGIVILIYHRHKPTDSINLLGL